MIVSQQTSLLHSLPQEAPAGRDRSQRPLRILFLAVLFVVCFFSLKTLGQHFPIRSWFFMTLLALLAEALPVTGPHGRRITLRDGVGLACALILPPPVSALPLLLAGGLAGLSRPSAAAQRETLINALWVSGAALIGSAAFPHWVIAAPMYATLLFGSKVWQRRSRRIDIGLEMAALTASAPAVLLMLFLTPLWGFWGLIAAALLMGLLLLVAHFAFETALLREQVRALEAVGVVTLTQHNLPRLIERFLQVGGALASSQRACLWSVDVSKIYFDRVACLDTSQQAPKGHKTQLVSSGTAVVRFGEGLVGRVGERQLPLIVADGGHDLRAVEAERGMWPQTPFSMLLLPLVVNGETLGVAQFERDGGDPYTRRDLSRLQALVNQAAAAMSNAQRHRAVTDQAVTDGLTGLFNRRYIQSTLESEQRRAVRYGHMLSIIMLDVDHFKSYNDTYGHTQGDVLIKKAAGLLRANVRAVDIVARYGGEEFIVLMPETSQEEARATAERLRLAVAETAFPGFADDPDMAVQKTISLGVATLPDHATDTAVLVTRADQALYESKRSGRNRVTCAEPLPSTVWHA